MNRRALLSAFLAAPVAVKLAPFVKPAPVYTVTLGGSRAFALPCLPAAGESMVFRYNSQTVTWSLVSRAA